MVNKRYNGDQKDLPNDLLTRMIRASNDGNRNLSSTEMMGLTTTNVLAGPGTTAVILRALFYHMCRNPHAYQRLQEEVDGAFNSGALSLPIRYDQASKLEYLNAAITEALRVHPATGFILEREVPSGGAEIAGTFVPAGTVVGINAWVMHANKQVFGEDAERFRPERWLGDDEKIREMKRCHLTVGLTRSLSFIP